MAALVPPVPPELISGSVEDARRRDKRTEEESKLHVGGFVTLQAAARVTLCPLLQPRLHRRVQQQLQRNVQEPVAVPHLRGDVPAHAVTRSLCPTPTRSQARPVLREQVTA